MLPTRIFAELTQPEIAAQFKRNPLILLPAGSVEQHGAHLPANTDILAAEHIACLVAERMDGLVLPATSVGVPEIIAYWSSSSRRETWSLWSRAPISITWST